MFYNISKDSYNQKVTMPCDLRNADVVKGKGNRKAICTYFMTLDLETSHNYSKDNKDFKVWSYQQAQALFDSKTGELLEYNESRNILELVSNLLMFDKNLKNKRGIVFIHNMKFDIQFFRRTLIEAFKAAYPDVDSAIAISDGGLYEDFLTDSKTWLYFRIHNLEFRCSWRLTNQSLYAFTKDMGVEHRKLLDANDYGVHYSDEELTEDYHKYMFNDVVGLGEALCQMMKIEKLTLATLPWTSTGFPRKDVKSAFTKNKKEIAAFAKSKPTVSEFKIWLKSYSGGLTQANEKYVEQTIDLRNTNAVIRHRDFVSFYPSLICTQKFPLGRGDFNGDISLLYKKDNQSIFNDKTKLQYYADKLKSLVYDEGKCIFARVLIINYKINKGVIPFIPRRHIENVKSFREPVYYSHKLKELFGSFELCTNTVELKMLYEYSKTAFIIPLEVYEYKARPIPRPIFSVTLEYFEQKTKYKQEHKQAVLEQAPNVNEVFARLQRSKGKLNGIYGMLVESLIKDGFSILESGEVETSHVDIFDDTVIKNALDDYYGEDPFNTTKFGSCKNGKCLSYAHGVYITAYAKYYLFKFCDAINWDNVLYVDTDSAFYISNSEIEAKIAELNTELRHEAEIAGAFIEHDGKKYYLHAFDDEEENILMFKALNAKRYMYYGKNKKNKVIFKLTSAGITAGTNIYEDVNGNAVYKFTREMEICGYDEPVENLDEKDIERAFENFKNASGPKKHDGFIFKRCGGTTAKYTYYQPDAYEVDGHWQWSEGGIAIIGVVKELSSVNNYTNNEDDYDIFNDICLAGIVDTFRIDKMEEAI